MTGIGIIVKVLATILLLITFVVGTPYLLKSYSDKPEEQGGILFLILAGIAILELAIWLPLTL